MNGIYQLDFPSGHFYIGQSVNVLKRWRTHRSSFRSGAMKKHQPKLYNIWAKYGEPKFRFLLHCDMSHMTVIEGMFICEHWGNPLLANTNPNAATSRGVKRTHVSWQTGKKFTVLHRQRLSEAKKGKVGGVNNSRAKLTEDQVREIRATYQYQVKGHGSTTLAKKYGVSHRVILYAVSGEHYANVEN